ncbi:hypothetical protein CBR_g33974 [Chara braunii]|uniref:Integrase catalytic domain-containing protein n=1 Tax=Chara braunii TaxID=69332 RepID=A0A388LHJ5_CHABU|nr:hypothetical protein CBR_g33974 [Chara braunii]|eukprot:GBG81794.1 hypothetical protein CBR_g33974 [Chara braunii]
MKPPLAFSGEKKDEELNTWLRTVPMWVRAKRTLQEEEVITAASYLEGKAAKWLDGIVAKAGLGRRMADWGRTLTLEEFLDMVEARWHNLQQAQIATDAMLRLDQRKYKSIRKLTSTVENLIVVPGIRYDDQVLLTMFLRCLPENLMTLLASEARLEYHSFETLSRKALDLEATLGSAHPTPIDGRKKKSPQEWKKKGSRLMMVESDGTQTEIEELTDLMDGSEYDGEEVAKGSTLAAVVKTKAGGRVCTFCYGGGELNHKISFLVSDDLPFDMLLGMYYLEVAKPLFDWDKKVLKHKLPDGRTVRVAKYKASSLIETYGCLCASAFYNYYKQNQEEGMYLVYVSEKGEAVKTPPEIDHVVAKFPDLFKEPTGIVDREIVHVIEIIPGSKTPKGRIYRMAPAELDEFRRQLKELTKKGCIRPSTSPFGSPVLFVPKKGGTLSMCTDYRGLNAITVKNAKPLPRIDDLSDRVQGCKYYSKIDLKSDYHQIAIRPEDQHKTAFQTRYGLYEFVVMPFGLCNAPGTFQHTMNRIFDDYLDKFVVVYLDNILIFSKSFEEHAQHVETVLSLLRQHKYKVNLEKCEFGRTRILYLGHEVSAEGIRPEDAKVASIREWPRPQTVTEVRSFLGMCGYYRNFVKNYSTVASPLTDLTRLDSPWDWSDECEAAFKRLKHALMNHERDGPRTQAPLGLLKPLPIPACPGQSVSMDFMDTLVTSRNGKRHIFVIIDRFTKYDGLIAMPKTARIEHVIKLFMDNWVRDFGLPKSIVSDRDVRFTSELWKKTAEQLGSQLHMTSGNHPEANGQAEQMNRVVQHLLRHYIKPSQDDWDEKLPLIASLYNNAVHNSTGVSPNQLHLGWKPRSALDFLLPENQPSATPGTLEYGVQYEKLLQQAVEHIRKSQQAMIASENKHRRQSSFQVGECVWVKASELGQEFGISRKLMPQNFGPWEVLYIVGDEMDGPSYVIPLRGAGVSKLRMFLPMAVLFLFTTSVHFLLTEAVVPLANRRASQMMRNMTVATVQKRGSAKGTGKANQGQSRRMQPVVYPEFRSAYLTRVDDGSSQAGLRSIFYAKDFDGAMMHGIGLVEMKVYQSMRPSQSIPSTACGDCRDSLFGTEAAALATRLPPSSKMGNSAEEEDLVDKDIVDKHFTHKTSASSRGEVHLPYRIITAKEGRWDEERGEWVFFSGAEYHLGPDGTDIRSHEVHVDDDRSEDLCADREQQFLQQHRRQEHGSSAEAASKQGTGGAEKGSKRVMGPAEKGMGAAEQGIGPAEKGTGPTEKGMGPAEKGLVPFARRTYGIKSLQRFDRKIVTGLGRMPLSLAEVQRGGDFDSMTLKEILNWKRLLEKACDVKGSRRIQVKMHQRLALPFACFIFGILGSLISLLIPSDQQKVGLICTLALVFGYYILSVAGSLVSQEANDQTVVGLPRFL